MDHYQALTRLDEAGLVMCAICRLCLLSLTECPMQMYVRTTIRRSHWLERLDLESSVATWLAWMIFPEHNLCLVYVHRTATTVSSFVKYNACLGVHIVVFKSSIPQLPKAAAFPCSGIGDQAPQGQRELCRVLHAPIRLHDVFNLTANASSNSQSSWCSRSRSRVL